MSKPFEASRADGRSDRQVVYEMVCDAPPETLFTYDELTEALQVGIDKPITRRRIGAAVRQGNRDLSKRNKRSMIAVRDVGYRIIRADEHHGAALVRKGRAERQMKRGIELLRNVREDELDPQTAQLYRGTAMVWSGIADAMQLSKRRIDQHDGLINDLRSRVERLEGDPPVVIDGEEAA